MFRDVGQAFLVSILDLHALNPMSRLAKSAEEATPEGLQAALEKLRKDLKREYMKPSIKSLKKKGAKTRRGKREGPTFELVLGDNNRAAQQEIAEEGEGEKEECEVDAAQEEAKVEDSETAD